VEAGALVLISGAYGFAFSCPVVEDAGAAVDETTGAAEVVFMSGAYGFIVASSAVVEDAGAAVEDAGAEVVDAYGSFVVEAGTGEPVEETIGAAVVDA
jgi:hypothetical protein